MKLLLVEDDPGMASFLKKGLEEEGYAVDLADDGREGFYLATTNTYDLMLFDVMVPFMDGIELCKEVRSHAIAAPIIFLTAKDDTEAVVKALEYGGDDYITKPFAFRELLARIQVRLRQGVPALTLQRGNIAFDPSLRQAYHYGEPVTLTQKELAILELLLRNVGKVLSESLILDHVWNQDQMTQSNIVRVYMYRLRKKIDPDQTHIKTIKHAGYMML